MTFSTLQQQPLVEYVFYSTVLYHGSDTRNIESIETGFSCC